MSPVDDGTTRIYRDKDSIFRNERGLLAMPHVTAFLAVVFGILVGIAGVIGFFMLLDGSGNLVTAALAMVGGGAGLEAWQTNIESRNQR